MIEKAATHIVRKMQREHLLNSDMEEHNIYALITLTEKWLTVTTIIVLSLIFEKVVPTFCFLMFFFSLRKRTGGYHAKEFWICYIESIIAYVILIFICPVLIEHECIMYGLLLLSCCIILAIGTVNHPNIHMDEKEMKASKMMARYIVLIELTMILTFIYFGVDKMSLGFMSSAVMLCAILLSLAKLIKQEVILEET